MLQSNMLTLGVVFPLVCNCLSILSAREKCIGEDIGGTWKTQEIRILRYGINDKIDQSTQDYQFKIYLKEDHEWVPETCWRSVTILTKPPAHMATSAYIMVSSHQPSTNDQMEQIKYSLLYIIHTLLSCTPIGWVNDGKGVFIPSIFLNYR